MKYDIKPTPLFLKAFKRLRKRYASFERDYEKLQEDLKANPALGKDLGDDMRKVRMAITSKGKGKSGGARVITVISVEETVINLLFVYDKFEIPDIPLFILKKMKRECGL